MITASAEYQNHHRAIGEWLDNRNLLKPGELDPDPNCGRTPAYVARFLRQCRSGMEGRGRMVPLEKIWKAEWSASGHCDYQHKLALHLTELELAA